MRSHCLGLGLTLLGTAAWTASCGGSESDLFTSPGLSGSAGADAAASGAAGTAGAGGAGGAGGFAGSSGAAAAGGQGGAQDASAGGSSGAGGTVMPDAGLDVALESASEAAVDATPPPDAACFPGTKLCQGVCVSSQDPAFGCGQASCEPCNVAHGVSACSNGVCSVASCAASYADCNGSAADGCETNTSSDLGHCGACNKGCSLPGANAVCNQGSCLVSNCLSGFGDCDFQPVNGCETSLANNVAHCGSCTSSCSYPNGVPACNSGQCALTGCLAGFGNCDGIPSNGCETATSQDAAHCGTCGNSCVGVPCVNGQCQPTVPVKLADSGSSAFDIAVDANHVYWGSSSGVRRVPKAGGTPTVLATGSINGIAVDGIKVYFVDNTASAIRSVPLGGGATSTLASGLSYPWRVATDGVFVVFTDSNQSSVYAVPAAGGATTVLASGLGGAAGVAMDATNAYYTTNTGGAVGKVALSGGVATTLASGETNPIRVAVDATHAYFTTYTSAGALKKVPIAGGAVVTLAASQTSALAIAIDGGWVYWTDSTSIKKIPVQGGTPTIVASGQSTPNCLALDATRVYWVNHANSTVMAAVK